MNEKINKIFVVKKNKEECYLREVKEYFEDKDKYLQFNPNITVGNFFFQNKKHSINQSNKTKNPDTNYIKFNSEGESFIHQKRNNTVESKKYKNKKFSSRPVSSNDVLVKSKNKNKVCLNSKPKNNLKTFYIIKSPNEIIDIFHQYKNIHNNNIKNNKNNNDYISDKSNNSKKYILQEKALINNEKMNQKDKKYSKYLSNKLGKKEHSLMFNGSNKYLIKRQIINYLYKNKLLSEKYGKNYWMINLRRPNQQKREYRINYINNAMNVEHEKWEQIFDPGNDDLELVNNPNNYDYNISQKNENYKFFNSFIDLKVEGKNLFEKEYNSFMDGIMNKDNKNNIKIKLYKDPCEQNIKNIRNIIFKENYLNYQKCRNKKNQVKKSSFSHKKFSYNYKIKEKDKIYL